MSYKETESQPAVAAACPVVTLGPFGHIYRRGSKVALIEKTVECWQEGRWERYLWCLCFGE